MQRFYDVGHGPPYAELRFVDRLIMDDLMISEVRVELLGFLRETDRNVVVINFHEVEYYSSAALGLLIEADRLASKRGMLLGLSDIRDEVHEVFAITKTNRLFNDVRPGEYAENLFRRLESLKSRQVAG